MMLKWVFVPNGVRLRGVRIRLAVSDNVGGGGGAAVQPPPPLKIHTNIGFIAILVRIP